MSKNFEVIDIKPKNNLVIDTKPKIIEISRPIETEQAYSVTVNAGQWMGFLNFTYPTTFTVTTYKAGE